ncbi:crotonase/enoyl-CoA hydratase family protein [Sphingoaurantiacus capsulatus]|uniref:Crotonase/enoyl-CoA hydratase family protein n=1 Tax=Sphingoaurantiacus capsulatus TaxID=1771310 RepID=A0ABV7XC96_9SPHN
MSSVAVDRDGPVTVIAIDRPDRRNAVDRATAQSLYDAFRAFDADDTASVAILTGRGGSFCAGADLKSLSEGGGNAVTGEGLDSLGPMGPTRLRLGKPVIAAIEGHAVAGGMELAVWCDLRVMAADATFGIFCRRFGVPLIDMGTVRLPRLIGHSRAMDLLLTGRPVGAEEALAIGLANRVAPPGGALDAAIELATSIAAFPQLCLRNDRLSAIEQWELTEDAALRNETRRGLAVIRSGETLSGATRFASGAGRGGNFES